MMGSPLVHWGVTIAVAVVAWNISRNVDGPMVHIGIAALAGYLAWSVMKGMG